MIDTRNISRIIMDKTNDAEEDLLEQINTLEESKVEERYITNIEEKTIKSLNTLLEYYDKLHTNVDRLNFYKFVSFVMKDDEQTTELFKELKNLSLLNRTGLLKYAHSQEEHSRQVISNFLLKLGKIESNGEDNILDQEIEMASNKLTNLREFKGYFAPIGIVKEVSDASKYNEFLDTLNLTDKDKVEALLMSLDFNVLLHEEKLSMYEFDMQKKTDCATSITKVTNPKAIRRKATKKKLNSILKKIKEESTKQEEPVLVEEPVLIEEPVLLETIKEETKEEKELKRLEEATKKVQDNKDKDPYDLFNEYYDTLLGTGELDTTSINIVSEYLDKHHKLIENMEPIVKKDLEDTYNVYKNNEDLRQEVYKTTENIERLLTYEINEIFNNIDVNDSENLVLLTKKVEPISNYIDELEKNKKK